MKWQSGLGRGARPSDYCNTTDRNSSGTTNGSCQHHPFESGRQRKQTNNIINKKATTTSCVTLKSDNWTLNGMNEKWKLYWI